MKYVTGKRAYFMCGKCGCRGWHRNAVEDGQFPGLLVHRACRDIKHESEQPFDADDAIALERPQPDTGDDSVGDTGQSLATALGFSNHFGGGT